MTNDDEDIELKELRKHIDANTSVAVALGITPAPVPAVTPPQARIERPIASNSQIENDAEYARTNIYDIIEQGAKAVDLATNIASESLHPRALEVLGQLLKVQSDNVDKLLKLHADKQKLNAAAGISSVGASPITVQNAVFVGTTTELLDMIRREQKVIDVEVDEE